MAKKKRKSSQNRRSRVKTEEKFDETAVTEQPQEEPKEEVEETKSEEEVQPEEVVEEPVEEVVEESTEKVEEPIEEPAEEPQVKSSYREVVYVGTANISTARGAVTGTKYEFFKDNFGMPQVTLVDESDYPGIIAIKGKGCVRRNPDALFVSKSEWELEIAEAKQVNR